MFSKVHLNLMVKPVILIALASSLTACITTVRPLGQIHGHHHQTVVVKKHHYPSYSPPRKRIVIVR